MKYIEDYLAEQMKIKVLGELKTIDEEAEPCMPIGKRLVIDDKESIRKLLKYIKENNLAKKR